MHFRVFSTFLVNSKIVDLNAPLSKRYTVGFTLHKFYTNMFTTVWAWYQLQTEGEFNLFADLFWSPRVRCLRITKAILIQQGSHFERFSKKQLSFCCHCNNFFGKSARDCSFGNAFSPKMIFSQHFVLDIGLKLYSRTTSFICDSDS